MSKFSGQTLLAALMAALGSVSCSKSNVAAAAPPVATTSPVAQAPSAPKPDTDVYATSGPLVVENQLDVLAQRDGIVQQIAADIGRHVSKGELLAQLDDRQLQAQLAAQQQDLQASQANHNRWVAQTGVAQADLDRAEALFKLSVISPEQVEHARYARQAAQFEAEREAHNVDFFLANIRATQLEIEKTRILAPFDGVVARRYIRAGQKVAPNDRLFWVTAVAPLQVRFTLPQEFVGKVMKGSNLHVSVAASVYPYSAQVVSVSPVVDPASGTIEVIAQLTGATSGLYPGMTVDIRIPRK
jgi:membrane fusion protein (multidrug efflux system)